MQKHSPPARVSNILSNSRRFPTRIYRLAPWLDRSTQVTEFGLAVDERARNNLYAQWSELTWRPWSEVTGYRTDIGEANEILSEQSLVADGQNNSW